MSQNPKTPLPPDQLAAWLQEHLSYELLMLRLTYSKLSQVADQADWNAFYESFAVHARNLYYFLTNEEELQARHFVTDYKAVKTNETKGPLQRLALQVFHLSKDRPPTSSRRGAKIDAEDRQAVYSWIEDQMTDFVRQLPKSYAEAWAKSDAATLAIRVPRINREQLIAMMGASSQPTITSSITKIITTSESVVPKKDQH